MRSSRSSSKPSLHTNNWQNTIVGLSIALLATFCASGVLGMDKKTTEKLKLQAINSVKYALPVNRLDKSTSSGADGGQYIGATSSSATLGCTPGSQDAIRGLTFGCTYYDFQRNGSMNRMIVTNEPSHILNFTWTNQDNNSITGFRDVRFEGFDPSIGILSDGTGGVDIGGNWFPARSGFPTIDSRGANGLAVNSYHWDPSLGAGSTENAWIFYNNTPSLADYSGQIIDTANVNLLKLGNATELKWPRVAYTNDGAGTEVTHLLINSNRTDADGQILYTRKVGIGGAGVWDPAFEVGAGGFHLSGSITASRKAGSQKVVIAAALGRGDGTQSGGYIRRFNGQVSGQNDNDIFYMESNDAGATWGPLTNVTMRPDSLVHLGNPIFNFSPAAKLDVLYDQSDVFHIVWQAAIWNGYQGPFTTQGRFFHYDPTNDKIRIVHDFVWDQTKCNGGLFNLNATNPQISECDNKLYVTFEQFNDIPNGIEDDCSQRAPTSPEGAANGDIYVTVSDNGGLNWDLKRNLTATYTPNCDTILGGAFPDCDSDVWHSTTRYGVDVDVNTDDFDAIADLSANIGGYAGSNYLFVQYVNDSEPGGAINAEGAWTNNSMKVFRFGCVEKVSNPTIVLPFPTVQAVSDPAFTLPGQDSAIAWTLTNVSNQPANYSITILNDSPAGNIAITGSPLSGVISEGDPNFASFALILNANLETTVQHAHAEILIEGDLLGGPRTFLFDYTIGDLQLRKIDTLANMLVFSNQGGVGLQNNGGAGGLTMDFQDNPASSECDTTGNADNYLFDGSPIVSYNNGIVVTSMFSNNIVDSFQFRPLSPPSSDEVSDPDWFLGNSSEFTTQDSLLRLSVTYASPKTSIWNRPNWKVVFAQVNYYLAPGASAPLDSVFCAYGWDWDAPSDSGSRNSSFFNVENLLIGLRGLEAGQDTGNTACLPNDQRYAASLWAPNFQICLPDYTDAGSGLMATGFQAFYTRDNASFIEGNWVHSKLNSALRSIVGISLFNSSASDSQEVDLHLVLNSGAYRIDPDDTLSMVVVMITGIGSREQFDSSVALIRLLRAPLIPTECLCCVVPGDYNDDGQFNIADVTSAINSIFCPTAFCPPPPCLDQADFNSDGSFNIADVTAMIARIFSGGPPPVCGTTGR